MCQTPNPGHHKMPAIPSDDGAESLGGHQRSYAQSSWTASEAAVIRELRAFCARDHGGNQTVREHGAPKILSLCLAASLPFLGGCSADGSSLTGFSLPASAALTLPAQEPGNASPPVTTGAATKSGSAIQLNQSSAVPDIGSARRILGFRAAYVTVYSSDSGNAGQRLPADTLKPPLNIEAMNAATKRLQIMTVDGSGWISSADAVLESTPQ